jgi:hypothetical protein
MKNEYEGANFLPESVQVEHPMIKPSSERIEIDKQKRAKAQVAKK